MTDAQDDLFGNPDIDLNMQIKCIERELKFRKRVYERRVSEGKMTKGTATYEIQAMTEVGKSLVRLKALQSRKPEDDT